MIRVFVVSSSAVARAGLAALIEASPPLVLAGTASEVPADLSGPGLAFKAGGHPPDVLVVELEEDEMGAITEMDPGEAPPIVLLASDPPPSWVAEALRAGVQAVLPRSTSAAELAAAIEAAAAGLIVLHPDTAKGLLDEALLDEVPDRAAPRAAAGQIGSAAEPLTPRELQILGMLAQGLGNKQIAWQLKISEHTVKFHLASIFGKLGASTRTEAVTQGLRRGLIML